MFSKDIFRKVGLFIIRVKYKKGQYPSIISNDCWAGEIYKITKSEFNSPFIGLMIMAPDYIKLLENLENFLSKDLFFTNTSRYDKFLNVEYPIGLLGNEIEIHFMHYSSAKEALEKWNRRVKRINYNNLYLKFDCSKDYATDEHIERFEKLPYLNKICLSAEPRMQYPSILHIPEWHENAVKMVYRTYKYFNIFNWLLKKPTKPSIFDHFLYKLFLQSI